MDSDDRQRRYRNEDALRHGTPSPNRQDPATSMQLPRPQSPPDYSLFEQSAPVKPIPRTHILSESDPFESKLIDALHMHRLYPGEVSINITINFDNGDTTWDD